MARFGVVRRKTIISSIFSISFLFIFFLPKTTSSQTNIVKTLPGFEGDLPFKLETGYISLGRNDEVQFFYYFIESERDPMKDPLVLSLTGALVSVPSPLWFLNLVCYFSSPIMFDWSTYFASLPSLVLNPYSWTKMANIIFVDWPVGAGFSYATNPEAYYVSDSKSPEDLYIFLQKWFLIHPMFLQNPLYIEGESYAGRIAPMVAWEISKANEAGRLPKMSLQGYFVSSPVTDINEIDNDKIPYAHNMGLISNEYYKLAEDTCGGNYANPDPNNIQCHYALQLIDKVLENVDIYHILDTACAKTVLPGDNSAKIVLPSRKKEPACRADFYSLSETWANDARVRKALQIREGTKEEWVRFNNTVLDVAFDMDVASSAEYHLLLAKKGYRGLVYNGDHDMRTPFFSTLNWIHSLNLTIDESWRQWIVDKQIAGFTQQYRQNKTNLTFATVKGSGHTIAEYNPKECFALISRWLFNKPL
ncbi:hypothetical protein ACJIZ3_011396 [Penstemon smallii]|uniref:Carboxypeptidase n=1 Tax=Penstemon smallii TaxID=265156 RepID=A0ABD3UJ16_9LAMI